MSEPLLFWIFSLLMFAAGVATGCQHKRDVVAKLSEDNERLRRLAYDYIKAYEKLAFGEDNLSGG